MEFSVDDSVFSEVDITDLRGCAFDGGRVAITADEVGGVNRLEGGAPVVRRRARALLGESRHFLAPLGKSVTTDVFQADVECVIFLKFFEDGKIGLSLAVSANDFFATAGEEAALQASPVGDGFLKEFFDPKERDVGDAFEEVDQRPALDDWENSNQSKVVLLNSLLS